MDYDFKVAGYLDEAGEDPAIAAETLRKYNIHYTVLRNVWGGKNICTTSDNACQKVRGIISDNNLSVVSICSNLGNVPSNQLMQINDKQVNRVFDIAQYMGASSVRILAGTKVAEDSSTVINEWMAKISELSVMNNVVPMLEITDDAQFREPAQVANLLSKFKRWKIQYDPVQIIIKRKIDPFVRYWSLLKDRVAAIDVRDYNVGRGFKPPGFGDAKITEVLEDAASSHYKGWLFVEPNLGRKYGEATTKADTFGLALEGLQYIIG